MQGQGRSKQSAGEDGRIVDRLAGLDKVISAKLIRQALAETGRVNGRACELTYEVVLRLVLIDAPADPASVSSRAASAGEKCPGRSNLCPARKRLGLEPVLALHRAVVRPLATPETLGAYYRGRRLMGIDGVVMDVPNSAANAEFGRATGHRGDAAFPQVRQVSLVELGTHLEVALVIGGYRDGETTLARQLWDHLPADALQLEDRGFLSYGAWKALESWVKLLVRVARWLL